MYTSAEGWGAFDVEMMREGAQLLILLAFGTKVQILTDLLSMPNSVLHNMIKYNI
jgi:hypothetical protein